VLLHVVFLLFFFQIFILIKSTLINSYYLIQKVIKILIVYNNVTNVRLTFKLILELLIGKRKQMLLHCTNASLKLNNSYGNISKLYNFSS
jgi:hypothetical protein